MYCSGIYIDAQQQNSDIGVSLQHREDKLVLAAMLYLLDCDWCSDPSPFPGCESPRALFRCIDVQCRALGVCKI